MRSQKQQGFPRAREHSEKLKESIRTSGSPDIAEELALVEQIPLPFLY
jgi:hypothetical protein